jgi:oligoribonuclease (3'-5' exoribonuclease)
MSKAMDDETLDELAKRWCLKGIFKMGMKETAERARVDAWELVVEVRRLRDHLFAVTAERDEALAKLAKTEREIARLKSAR